MTDAATDTSTETQTPDTEPSQGRDYEKEARRLGWRPQDEYRGDPDHWIDAQAFVERGEQLMPILKKNNAALERSLHEHKAEIAELKQVVTDMAKFHQETEAKAYERAMRDLKAERQKAVTEGDGETFEAIESRIQALEEARREVASASTTKTETPATSTPDPRMAQEFTDWANDNPWYITDSALRGAADGIGAALRAEGNTLEGREFFDAVKDRMKGMLPRPTIPAENVDAGGSRRTGSGAPRGKHTYDALPQEAKTVCDRLVRNNVLTREQYVKDYFINER